MIEQRETDRRRCWKQRGGRSRSEAKRLAAQRNAASATAALTAKRASVKEKCKPVSDILLTQAACDKPVV